MKLPVITAYEQALARHYYWPFDDHRCVICLEDFDYQERPAIGICCRHAICCLKCLVRCILRKHVWGTRTIYWYTIPNGSIHVEFEKTDLKPPAEPTLVPLIPVADDNDNDNYEIKWHQPFVILSDILYIEDCPKRIRKLRCPYHCEVRPYYMLYKATAYSTGLVLNRDHFRRMPDVAKMARMRP